jgi:hypothetical protein
MIKTHPEKEYTTKQKDFIKSWSQLVLYAKGHFERSDDIFEDINKIISDRCMVDKVSDSDVFGVVSSLFHTICGERLVEDLFKDIHLYMDNKFFGIDRNDLFGMETLIVGMLGKIGIVPVQNDDGMFFELDEPNYDILPMVAWKEKENETCIIKGELT